ncbi:MAG TPA: hypothetical protein VFU55_00230 [Terracidiphilus sp.]|nr:hypothetical protein [Terracidiphilus sp.]
MGFVASGGLHFRAGDADEEDVVAGDFKRHVVGERDVLAGPEVPGLLIAVEAEPGEVEMEGRF